eukprot:CAMPEP_0116129074 /NCGR_PEP_ID=MMETSP0329-20121206/7737_1 /TAXON_ID=697910 /ORGANISM="Pseudo-nitzschia arenysensis, Strain B593" /LENGTH=537 /DNA_ID=CAMNT_0003623331 /DNA_START=87 /DNA_END=1700 /DNA_ORIENTATION=-
MTTLRSYKRVGYALVIFALFQIILIFDTIRNSPENQMKRAIRKEPSLFEINEGIVAGPASKEGKEIDYSSEEILDHDDDDIVENSGHDSVGGQWQPTIYWLNQAQVDQEKGDFDSGSALMPIKYLKSLNVKDIRTMEDFSSTLYSHYKSELRMSVDWLDFSVEDTKEWYTPLDLLNVKHNDVAINTLKMNLVKYVSDTPEKTKALLSGLDADLNPDLNPTIAIIPFSSTYIEDFDAAAVRSATLTMTTLGATIASLLRAGVGRIVCTGIDDTDDYFVKETFAWVAELYANRSDWIAGTEFNFVRMDEELYNIDSKESRVRGSIYGLQRALKGKFNETYAKQWVGLDANNWKYVIVSEPGFVHQTRADSLPAIGRALERGRVLIPHRFLPLLHRTDLIDDKKEYDGTNEILPKTISPILEVNDDDDYMCCDGGNNRPSWTISDDPLGVPCQSSWWNCGYTEEWVRRKVKKKAKHRRILKYAPLIRLKQGTDIVSLPGTKNRRQCHPRKRQKRYEICEQPSSSGRSYATLEIKNGLWSF